MANIIDLVYLLRDRPGLTCTEIGESLWPGNRTALRQSYARPAGRLAKRAIEAGVVREGWSNGRRVFYATEEK